MEMMLEITGLNLERLLNIAANAGILVRGVQRIDMRRIRIHLPFWQRKAFSDICERYGWEARIISTGWLCRLCMWSCKRPMALAGLALYVLLMVISSGMIWQVRIDHADKSAGEVRRFLREERIGAGRWKQTVSISKLREQLLFCAPDLAYAAVGYEGSRLVITCQPSLEKETTDIGGQECHLVAAQDGLITGIVVKSGTPAVSIGQVVRQGDILIRGEERGEKQSLHPVIAQGEVTARVWVRGDARAARSSVRTVETGAVRRRVTISSPWHRRQVTEAIPFENQDVSTEEQKIVGLYVPLVREIETLAETVTIREERSTGDTLSLAQGTAEQLAKNKCPPGVHILDKSVENSMIDNEYVYAAVVLAYEDSIAVRGDHQEMIRQ